MTIESAVDLAGMREVGRLVGHAIKTMRAATQAGITTHELDDIGAEFLRRHGARSAPRFAYGFPGFNLISVNEEIVHGVPGPRVLRAGDVVKIDVTAELGGYIADSADTVLIAPVADDAWRLRRCAEAAFARAMRVARTGGALRAIGREIESEVRRRGFSVVRELSGHGVGRTIHEAPEVPNYDSARATETLTEGLVLAVEPILSLVPARVVEERDGWTLRTHNRTLAVHYEHTVVIRRGRPLVLTAA
ncbi:MAG: type I methionyl aminopeptidase [Gemmatimonadaceae bacterium]